MKGTVVARVRRVLRGHSERSLVHAVTDIGTDDVPAGLEYKLELPSNAVPDLIPGQELVLTLTWALEPAVTTAPPPAAPTALPSAIDEEFMALMARRRGASPAPAIPATGPPLSAAEELARRLGIRPARTS